MVPPRSCPDAGRRGDPVLRAVSGRPMLLSRSAAASGARGCRPVQLVGCHRVIGRGVLFDPATRACRGRFDVMATGQQHANASALWGWRRLGSDRCPSSTRARLRWKFSPVTGFVLRHLVAKVATLGLSGGSRGRGASRAPSPIELAKAARSRPRRRGSSEYSYAGGTGARCARAGWCSGCLTGRCVGPCPHDTRPALHGVTRWHRSAGSRW